MMTRLPMILLVALSLPGCSAQMNDVRGELAHTGERPPCDATAVQGMIGQRADVAMVERLLQGTGAENFRWAPPNSALTMDYREDRLTVAYDNQMAITRISCG